MKKLMITAVATTSLLLSGVAAAQQPEQDATAFISEQIANVSTELFNATKASVIETLDALSHELLTSSVDEQVVATDKQAETQNNQPPQSD